MTVPEILAQKVSVGRWVVNRAWRSIAERAALVAQTHRPPAPLVEPAGHGIAG
jgi:hypothetical protein